MTAGLDPERQGSSSGRAKAAAEDVAVAESWLASDGRVRGLDLHWQRFERGYADARLRPSVSRAAVESAFPVSGRWFPRVDTRSDGELRVAAGISACISGQTASPALGPARWP